MRVNIPKAICLSVALLFVVNAIGLREMVLLSRILGVPLWMPYSTLAFLYSLLALLLVMILLGKRWARTTYTILAIINLLSLAGHVTDISLLGWMVATAKGAAIWMLYVAGSEPWFNRSSPNNSFKPKPLRGSA